jgi:general stress protein 26
MSKTYTMLLPAGDLKDHQIVAKATGTKKYAIHRKVVVEGHGEITAKEGTVFLVSTESSNWINSVKADLLVKVVFDRRGLRRFVNEEEDKHTIHN